MIGTIATALLKHKLVKAPEVAERAARGISWALVVLLVLGLTYCAVTSIRKDAVNDAETASRADAAEAGVQGRTDAAATDEEREAFAREDERTQGKMEDAETENPEAAGEPVGPVSGAYFDSLPRPKPTRSQ